MEKRTKARMVLFGLLAVFFVGFIGIAQIVIVSVHPEIRQAPPPKETLFQVKSADDLATLDEQLFELSSMAVEMKEVVLVTGGSGFICSHFVDLMLREGYQVIVMDRTLDPTFEGTRENWKMKKGKGHVPSFIHVYGDVTNKEDLKLIPDIPISYVFHCAGKPPPSEYMTNLTRLAAHTQTPSPSKLPEGTASVRFSQRQSMNDKQATIKQIAQEEFDKIHVESTRNLLQLFESREFPIQKFMVLSTTDIYGALARSFLPFSKRRNHPNPPNPWAQSKLNMEKMIQKTWRKRTKVKSHAIIRPTTVYGPRQTQGPIPDLIHSALKGDPMTLPMHGMYTRDFVFVNDLVQSIYSVMLLPKGYVEVNIGSSEVTTLDDVAHTVRTLADSTSPIVYAKGVAPDITNQQAEINLVTPQNPIPLQTGIELAIESIQNTLPEPELDSPSNLNLPKTFSISSWAGL